MNDAAGFYVIEPPGGVFTTRVAYGERQEPDLISDQCEYDPCPVCGRRPGTRIWLPPHRLSLSQRKYPDLLWVSGSNICATPAFRQMFEACRTTGVTGYDPPASITRVGRRPGGMVTPQPPEYRRVRLAGWGANLDDAASGATGGLSARDSCRFCRPGSPQSIDRLVVESTSWTGLDIFIVRGIAGVVVVTERFRDLFRSHGLTGVFFCPCDRYSFNSKEYRMPPKTEEELARGYGRVPADHGDLYAQSPDEPD